MGVKLKDIAQAAGVSVSTVSRILSRDDASRLGGQTAKRVLSVAKDLGYGAELPARLQALAVGGAPRTYSIGCVLTSDHESFVSPFFSTLLAGIQNELARSENGIAYRLFVTNMRDKGFGHFMRTAKLDCGLMLGRTSLENINLIKERIPNLVYAGVNSIGADFDEVICDGYSGAVAAVRYLVGLGHRRIGYIGSTQKKYQVFNEHRYQGFRDEMGASGLAIDEAWVVDSPLTSADGYESMLGLISSAVPLPTAIFCGNDTVALGVLKALSEKGFSVPGDISVFGFDDIETASYVKPALSTISVPTKELGRLAVKVMLDKLETGRDYRIRVDLPFKLVERESCGRPAHA